MIANIFNKEMRNLNIYRLLSYLGLIILVPFLNSCNKEFPNRLLEYSEQQGYDAGSAKVLYIVVDGLRGQAVQDIQPTQLIKMQQNAMFGYGNLIDYKTNTHTKEIGWANLLTGTTSNKHNVIGSDLSQYKSDEYPDLLTRIKTLNIGYNIVANSSSEAFTKTFLKAANATASTNDDEVLQKTIKALEVDTNSVFIAHFTNIETVAEQNSYESEDDKYAAAVKKFDQQVAELINTIQSRQNYKTENWLIAINSSIGGKIDDHGVQNNTSYGDTKRNVFTMFYSPKFDRKFFVTPNSTSIPYTGSAVRYTFGTPSTNAVLNKAEAFNFGTNKNFTISFNFKSNIKDGNWNYPIFLSKRVKGFDGANGWNIFGEVRNGNMALGFNSNIAGQAFGTKINDGEWHNFTVTVTRGDSLRVFTDGVPNDRQATNGNNVNNDAPFVIGKKEGNDNSSPDVLISNVQIYDVAIPKDQVKTLFAKTHIDQTHPYYSNMLGYWPGYDDQGKSQITDLSGNNRNLSLTGNYNWVSFNDLVSYFTPPVSNAFYQTVPNGVDVPFIIYQWLGIIPQKSWELDGKSWTPVYKILK